MNTQNQVDNNQKRQIMTFYINENLYGIDVMEIQEVTGELPVGKVPLAPVFVRGLINLRGQIATALDLRALFQLESEENKKQPSSSVVCKLNGTLVAFLVDSLGDVIDTQKNNHESVPSTIPGNVGKFLKGIYKNSHQLLSIIDLNKLNNELSLSLDQ